MFPILCVNFWRQLRYRFWQQVSRFWRQPPIGIGFGDRPVPLLAAVVPHLVAVVPLLEATCPWCRFWRQTVPFLETNCPIIGNSPYK